MIARVEPVDLRRWYYFQVLAEELNFTRAAARLYISQPSLSQQIRVLEHELGVQLLNRDGPRFTLTTAGQVAATEAAALLQHAHQAHARVAAAGRGDTGRLRLAYTRSATGPPASRLVAAYRKRYPEVSVEAETGWTSRNVERLIRDEVDLAFVRPPVESDVIHVETIGVEEVLIALPAAHPLTRHEQIDRAQIAREPVVFWSRANGSGWHDQISDQIWPDQPPTVAREEPDDEELLHAVAAGAGIAAVPEHRARALQIPGVTLRSLSDPVPRTYLALAYRCGEHNPLIENFVTLARAEWAP